MAYQFDKENDFFSGAPTLSYERDGVMFYICAADPGSFECGAIADLTPLSTHQNLDADAACELSARLFGTPRVTDAQLAALKDAAVAFWG